MGGMLRVHLRSARAVASAAAASLAVLAAGASSATATATVSASAPVSASAAMSFHPCASAPAFGCTRLAVALDHSGKAPGTISLDLERRLAGTSPSAVAVVALAGGPGQSATPLAKDLAQVIGPGLSGHDLIVFDQRGTGQSEALRCSALDSGPGTPGDVAKCARQIGPKRGFFTSADSAADLESIRQALGYQQLILYGTSYGTKVALLYALAHPQQTAGLLLDSTVLPTGPDVFSRSTLAAIPRVLADLCAAGACDGVTSSPLADLNTLAQRLGHKPLRGTVFDGTGHGHAVHIGPVDVLSLLVAGDEEPVLRAEEPAAVHSALQGDAAPLLRLIALASGAVPGASAQLSARFAPGSRGGPARAPVGRQATSDGIDNILYTDTTCEEGQFPWDRSAGAKTRLAQAHAAAAAIPAGDFQPFGESTSFRFGPIPMCASWPDASPTPATTYGPITGVPTLIISGEADLRTPLADAQTAAADIAGAQLLEVPHTGHSVLGSDFTTCSHNAIVAFFAGSAVTQCAADQNPFPPSPAFPARLAAAGHLPDLGGRAGATAQAVRRTIGDLHEEIAGAIIAGNLHPGARFGGLRGGDALVTRSGLVLHGIAFVPGVLVSGVAPVIAGDGPDLLTVRGPQAARGSLRITAAEVVGRLGGRKVLYRTPATAGRAGGRSAAAGIEIGAPSRAGFPQPALAHLP
jgi:pimeloyl-ACP methyl ester carboxylesterase